MQEEVHFTSDTTCGIRADVTVENTLLTYEVIVSVCSSGTDIRAQSIIHD
jgi:hypothetical protein